MLQMKVGCWPQEIVTKPVPPNNPAFVHNEQKDSHDADFGQETETRERGCYTTYQRSSCALSKILEDNQLFYTPA